MKNLYTGIFPDSQKVHIYTGDRMEILKLDESLHQAISCKSGALLMSTTNNVSKTHYLKRMKLIQIQWTRFWSYSEITGSILSLQEVSGIALGRLALAPINRA